MNTYKKAQMIAALDVMNEYLRLVKPIKETIMKFDKKILNNHLRAELQKISPLITVRYEKSLGTPPVRILIIGFKTYKVQDLYNREIYDGEYIDLSHIINPEYFYAAEENGTAYWNTEFGSYNLLKDYRIIAEPWCKMINVHAAEWLKKRADLEQEVKTPEKVEKILNKYRAAISRACYIRAGLSDTVQNIFEDEIPSIKF